MREAAERILSRGERCEYERVKEKLLGQSLLFIPQSTYCVPGFYILRAYVTQGSRVNVGNASSQPRTVWLKFMAGTETC